MNKVSEQIILRYIPFSLVSDSDGVYDEEDDEGFAPPPKKMLSSAPDDNAVEEGGKGFMAVKPWIGAIVPPTNPADQKVDTSRPDQGLELEWAYGYRSFDSKSNCVMNTRGHIIYPLAGLVIIYNRVRHSQTFFRSHTSDVRCLAQNPADRDWIVTGQNAGIENGHSTAPFVCVWNSNEPVSECYTMKLPANARAVRSVAFSPDGEFIAAVSNDDNHTVTIFDWRKSAVVASVAGDKNPIFQVRWNHVMIGGTQNVYELVTVGKNHACFYTFDSTAKSLKSKRITLGGAFPIQTYNSVTFSERGHACLGGFNGNIVICKQGSNGTASKAIPVTATAASGSKATSAASGKKATVAPKVFSLDTYQGGIVAGLSNKTIVQFDSTLAICKVFQLNSKVTSVHVHGKDLLVGTQRADIYFLKNALDPSVEGGSIEGRFEPIVSGHSDGELWAQAVFKDGKRMVTVGEDNSIIMWDIAAHKILARGVVNPKAGKAPVVKKASTTSTYPQSQCARVVSIAPKEDVIIVGTNDGLVSVFAVDDLTNLARIDLNSYGQRKVIGQEGNWCQTIEFNPDGTLVAVGTHGSVIVIMSVSSSSKFQVKSVIKSHHSFLTHMDWSVDGETLRSNDGAYEVLYHDVSDPSHPRQIGSATAMRDVEWATTNCPFSWGCVGVFEDDDGTNVNSVARHPQQSLLAAGDDHGKVNLYRYPVPAKGSSYIAYNGHSSHVTCVRWTKDGEYLFSTGGHDLALLQFKLGPFRESKSGRSNQVY